MKKGSSPLTRGKLRGDNIACRELGLIPAHAGKTPRPITECGLQRAHPRSRGENTIGRKRIQISTGSSPLTRGKPDEAKAWEGWGGLIPAHVGKTEKVTGECYPYPGSSPLTRGKPDVGPTSFARPRLIPAHAGKTAALVDTIRPRRAHPRSRGENPLRYRDRDHPRGSSPLTRGKHRQRILGLPHIGLIPAHAGKTSAPMSSSPVTPAHPRSRGENGEVYYLGEAVDGSSPLTRGKRR